MKSNSDQRRCRLFIGNAIFVLLAAGCTRVVSAGDWIVAPQICAGKAYSSSAKAAGWKFDEQLRVSTADDQSDPIVATRFPGRDSNFQAMIRVELREDAVCRLELDGMKLELTRDDERIRFNSGELKFFFDLAEKNPHWTTLQVKRQRGRLTVNVNDQQAFFVDDSVEAFEQVRLSCTKGEIRVSHFAVSGELQSRPAESTE